MQHARSNKSISPFVCLKAYSLSIRKYNKKKMESEINYPFSTTLFRELRQQFTKQSVLKWRMLPLGLSELYRFYPVGLLGWQAGQISGNDSVPGVCHILTSNRPHQYRTSRGRETICLKLHSLVLFSLALWLLQCFAKPKDSHCLLET